MVPKCLPKLSCAERSLHVNAMIPKTLYIPGFLISPQSSSSSLTLQLLQKPFYHIISWFELYP